MATLAAPYVSGVKAETKAASVPWPIWTGLAAVTSSILGLAWDISWHRSIGRDTFWTPAHMMIYACGALAAVMCAYLIFGTTFGKSAALKGEGVTVLGFRAPLGAFIAAWGGLAMIASGPFDNWWHAAYGLDVTVLSPPHVILGIGLDAIAVGVLFLILAAMNRSGAPTAAEVAGNSFAAYADDRAAQHARLQTLYLYLCGLMLISQMTFIMELVWDIRLHTAAAYITLAIAVPVLLGMVKRSSQARWACTIVASIYTLFLLAEIQLFPLIHATPKLGPVFFTTTHLVPMKFPILIVLPALALDLLWNRLKGWKTWQVAAVSGLVFVAVLVAFEWPFASFLISKASENRFFGTIYFDYNSPARGYDRMRVFYGPQHGLQLVRGLGIAVAAAVMSSWVGLKVGSWMREVQR